MAKLSHFFFLSRRLVKYEKAELPTEGFDIYFPHETDNRFHCLSICLPSSFSQRANSLCECLKCRRNTRNLELSDPCQLTLSENLQAMSAARQPRIPRLVPILAPTLATKPPFAHLYPSLRLTHGNDKSNAFIELSNFSENTTFCTERN